MAKHKQVIELTSEEGLKRVREFRCLIAFEIEDERYLPPQALANHIQMLVPWAQVYSFCGGLWVPAKNYKRAMPVAQAYLCGSRAGFRAARRVDQAVAS